MARELDTSECSAWIFTADDASWGDVPCRIWSEGKCLRDIRDDQNCWDYVEISRGECLADKTEK